MVTDAVNDVVSCDVVFGVVVGEGEVGVGDDDVVVVVVAVEFILGALKMDCCCSLIAVAVNNGIRSKDSLHKANL